MKSTRYIYAAIALVALAACTKEGPVYTVGEADNAIVLKAGIGDGHVGIATKAGAEDHHAVPGHLNFEANTKIALQVSGTWKDNDVVKSTTATIGAPAGTDGKHNEVSFASEEQLYWDDYGTADPDNAAGRAAGLTIYGVAVDGVGSAPSVSDWTALAWTLAADQKDGWASRDLLISNNVKDGGQDGTYRFNDRASGKLLEFNHSMSKITVRLIADEGFPETGIGATAKKFNSLPEVKLTSNQTGQSNAEWALTSSTVDVTAGTVSGQGTPAAITMHEQSRTDAAYTVVYDALVAPGSCFGTTDDATIARVNADGNIYYVSAREIRKKMYDLLSTTDYKTESGKNYIMTVKVKKTRIDVTATITDWVSVTADEVTPVINVNASYGSDANNFPKENFSFYRSTSLNSGYSNGMAVGSYFPCESVVSKPASGTEWDFATKLYWPTHDTHYQMRGVWPCTGTETGDVAYPRVEAATHNAVEYQVIKVKNVPYVVNTFPSDLAIGRPDVAADAVCHNADHTARNLFSDGICATEGTVNLAFEYMMSQVEVNLSTTTDDSRVELAGAVVEVTNLYTSGDVKLGDRDVFTTGSKSLYALNASSVANQWWDAVVPQNLAFTAVGAETNVRFKITITNGDGSKDIYYADVAPILKAGSTTEKVAPAGRWERGVHYVYNLKVAKTRIDVSATLKDWVTVNASEDVWF